MKAITLVALIALLMALANAESTAEAKVQGKAALVTKPNLFWGWRTREPAPATVTGLMWYNTNNLNNIIETRHACTEDGMGHYSWEEHDGRDYGRQVVVDDKHQVRLETTFIREEDGSIVARVAGASSVDADDATLALMVYAYSESDEGTVRVTVDGDSPKRFPKGGLDADATVGLATGAHTITLSLPDTARAVRATTKSPLRKFRARSAAKTHVWTDTLAPTAEMWRIQDQLHAALRESAMASLGAAQSAASRKRGKNAPPSRTPPRLPADVFPTLPNTVSADANAAAVQVFLKLPFTFEYTIRVAGAPEAGVDAGLLDAEIERRSLAFRTRFHETFGGGDSPWLSPDDMEAAQAALANVLGGIGYFYGRSLERRGLSLGGSARARPKYGSAHALFTGVPSRSFFPRGFLWDEGFHQMLVGAWDESLAREVIAHWMDAVDDDGWVAREQILGGEAESRVPAEFQVQHTDYANPPTFLLALRKMAEAARAADPESMDHGSRMAFLERVYPALKRNFEWFERTQAGSMPNTFRWRGRTANHTLTSGLDDYPRAHTPSALEKHVDLHAWMLFAAHELAGIAETLGFTADAVAFAEREAALAAALDATHWNPDKGMYCDRGAEVTVDRAGRRTVGDETFVCHLGYVSLFPLMLGQVPHDSPKLGRMLDAIHNGHLLWSKAGVRSLARTDPYYGQDENYWRGPIWINLNYMILSGLRRFYVEPQGPHQHKAQIIYTELRQRLVQNVIREYTNTGYFWEQYHPITGKGQRTHPFAGWTTLVVLMIAEYY